MIWLTLLPAVALADVPAPAWNVDPARVEPLRWEQPDGGTRATWIVSGRQTMDKLGVEVWTRQALDLEVAAGLDGGRIWGVHVQTLEVEGLSDFGPIDPEVLANQTRDRRLVWRTRRDGTVSETELGEDGLGDALQATLGGLAGALRIPAPPGEVTPGATWTADANLEVPVDTQGIVGRLTVATRAEATFLGWARKDDRWLALLDVAVELELSGRVASDRHALGVGGIGRTGSQVLLDPETGLAEWQAVRSRVTVSGGDRRPDVIEQVMVLTRR